VSNRLAHESSPYLLQHKDNPVDWYPWGAEAFERSRAEQKPIFLSIGYSTCHWCHVMEHESFEDPKTAEALNRDFVPIKVDREERPDVDDIYMQSVQLMTGQGGWPLSLFLTPDRQPFYGGTYFPPTPRWGKPGFPQLLAAIAAAWRDRRDELVASAAEMLNHLEPQAQRPERGAAPGRETIAAAVRLLERQYDARDGGFGGAPKFPPAMRLELLLRHWLAAREPLAREMIEKTLVKMAEGGMYDQVGGGFHRYSVDAQWLVPHFEKMLYDNAMLARVYLLAHRAFPDGGGLYARIARETLDYLLAEMTPEGGGFYAAQDADSGGEEGTYYVWNPRSLAEAVGAADAPLVAARFGVTEGGNFEHGETVLSIVRSVPDLAREFGRSEADVEAVLAEARAKMRAVRSRRVPPGTDDKLLTDWSALAIGAFALGAGVLAEPRYERAARAAADRILERCRKDGELLHREKAGRAGIPGFASDYAFLVEALLDLYEATFVPRYFAEAVRLQETFEARFADPGGGYFLSAEGHDGLILRPRENWDGATPSSNSVAALNLLRLAVFTGDDRYRRRAEDVFAGAADILARAPAALPRMLCAVDFAASPPREVVLGGTPGRADFERLREAVVRSPRLNRVVAHADSAGEAPALSALAEGRATGDGAARAWVCSNFACAAPVSEAGALAAALDAP